MVTNFSEGKTYEFLIRGIRQLAGDDQLFYLLEGPFGTLHLLSGEYYSSYGFRAGETVRCRLDKINCSGRMYLEPEHPYYREGMVYEFEISAHADLMNSEGKPEHFLVLNDHFGNESLLRSDDDTAAGIISCRVERIKKGKLLLSRSGAEQDMSFYQVGCEYSFIVEGITMCTPEDEFYRLKGIYGDVHFIKSRYFGHYGFSAGSEIMCRMLAPPALFRHYLEPRHPEYEIGKEYSFAFKAYEMETDVYGNEKLNMLLADDAGNKAVIAVKEINSLMKAGSLVSCIVEDIRMSRLHLRLKG